MAVMAAEKADMNLVEEVGAGLDGLGQLRALIRSGRRPGIARSLGFNLVEIESGRAVFAGTPGEHAYNPIGTVHGGYAATLLDSACGCAVHSQLTQTQAFTTLDLNVSFHRPITSDSGPLRAEGRVRSLGKRVAFAEAHLTDREGKLYASATSTLLTIWPCEIPRCLTPEPPASSSHLRRSVSPMNSASRMVCNGRSSDSRR
jgi:uncharacterized protein (TIGR00369 family)